MATTGTILRRSWRRLAIGVAMVALLLSLLGLRGELAGADARAKAGTAAEAASQRAKRKVEIEDFAYRPKTLRVRRGTRVVFVNRDGVAHTVTRRHSFDSGHIRPGGRFAVRFKRRGTFRYHCTIHPFMRGKVVVR